MLNPKRVFLHFTVVSVENSSPRTFKIHKQQHTDGECQPLRPLAQGCFCRQVGVSARAWGKCQPMGADGLWVCETQRLLLIQPVQEHSDDPSQVGT